MALEDGIRLCQRGAVLPSENEAPASLQQAAEVSTISSPMPGRKSRWSAISNI